MIIVEGKKIRDIILNKLKEDIKNLSFQPVFCDILVGEDSVSLQYVNMKMRMAESIGIKFHKAFFKEDISNDEILNEIKKINNIENICGIIAQIPLPKHLDKNAILNAINPELDVDCLGFVNSQKFYNGSGILSFPTARACIEILDSLGVDLKDKKIVVLGQGDLVGKPVTSLLRFRNLNVETIDSETENKEVILKNADVIVSGIGQGKYIKGDMVKKDVILIDAGTFESNEGIVGDVDLDSVKNIASYISPVPGGVGPVTVAMLLSNVVDVAKLKDKINKNE
ncbi:bifunctional 5,10-methylenetetrahydrofolate dehydrogenase/5,10-methenyltetrahydrofolate cyclohydrolase [Candidatus Nomurabacteria bacterium]|nr:bifunctional 5,10-methylenetetrahydrofolate dehydrogenase/5,10-methenyltetrahydrofolate cyclohydrolase [Candidatus Nomurabacteria bacterium]